MGNESYIIIMLLQRAARLEMAAAYRGLDLLGLNEGVCNHLSMMAPRADGKGQTMLVISYGLHWSEVRSRAVQGNVITPKSQK